MNNKGFTVVELLASFTLTMVIMVFLFEIVLQLKEVYITSALKTKIYDRNAIIATTLDNKLNSENIAGKLIMCEEEVCTIDGEEFVKIDSDSKRIEIFNQIIKYPSNINKIDGDFQIISECGDNIACDVVNPETYLVIRFYVTSKFLEKRIVFNYVKYISN